MKSSFYLSKGRSMALLSSLLLILALLSPFAHTTAYAIDTEGFRSVIVHNQQGWNSLDAKGDLLAVACVSECYVDAVNGNDANGGSSFTDAKKTIQAAINQLAAGGIVRVAAGSYPESPNITKPMRLIAVAGRDATTIVLQKTPTYLGALTIAASNVSIDGFTIQGFDAIDSSPASTNIWVTAGVDYIYILNNRLLVGAINEQSPGDDGIGVLTTYDTVGMVDQLMVMNNLFAPVATAGTRAFYVNPGTDQFIFSRNTISGEFMYSATTQARNGLVERNTLTGVGAAGSRSAGFGTWGYPDANIWGRTIFRNNEIRGVRNALSLYESDSIRVENNVFSDNDRAIAIREAAESAKPFTNIVISANSFVGNSIAAVENTRATGTAQAIHNWWGSDTGPSTLSLSTGGDMISGTVSYDPWLCNGVDSSSAVGFQPDMQSSPCVQIRSTIAITVYNGLDENGSREPTEPGLAGWKISVKQGNSTIASGNTYVDGSFAFDLPVGSYTVCEHIEPGWYNTQPADGSGCVSVTLGAEKTSVFFGNNLPKEDSPKIYLPFMRR